ncbi:MAG: hypothetical protein JWM02_1343 [Frankiales bacterium]|nr:hypothetical protein [Frankiales bacterium]
MMTTRHLPADPPRRPPGRYDAPRTLPRPLLITGAVLLGVLLLVSTYLAYNRFTTAQTAFGVVGFRVLSDHAVEVQFDVHKDLKASVLCLVSARDKDNVQVGSATVTVGPSSTDPVRTVHTLTTTHRATTGEVTGCSAPQPSVSP